MTHCSWGRRILIGPGNLRPKFKWEGGEEIMKYEKPEIIAPLEAVVFVQGSKIGGPSDGHIPQDPIHSPCTYQSDE